MFPVTAKDVAAASACDICFDDGTCSELECENELGCSWCESENCDKTCPCVPVSQGCSGYSQGTYCQFDEQCGGGLQCSGQKGGFEWEQACCPIGEDWLPDAQTCGTEINQKEYYTSDPTESNFSWYDDFPYSSNESGENVEYGSEGCTPGSCESGDLDCDGFIDEICFASPEVCDGMDNDIDGVIDDGVCVQNCGQCGAGALNACGREECEQLGNCVFTKTFLWWGTCAAGDFTEEFCFDNEICDNTVDDDCNGKIDDGCAYEIHFETPLPNVTDIGLRGYQEYYCIFDGQCNPPLKCSGAEFAKAVAIQEGMQNIMIPPAYILRKLGIMPSTSKMAAETNSAGGCCYEWEEWSHEDRECVDPRIGPNLKGCENDEECRPGLHCSWDAWTTTGACCTEGTEYDLEAGRCIECGVPVMKNDTNYCSKKEEIGCACNAGEGNCAKDTECFAGTYCSATETWMTKWWDLDICCPKGTTYNPESGTCIASSQGACAGSTKEECFASGETCCFENNTCSTCVDLKRNDKFCEVSSSCCDMENGCDDAVNLSCSFGVCCYPWEWASENTGRCEIYCPECDYDKDGYPNDLEQRVFSNPLWVDDTPWLRTSQSECGSMFEKFEIEEVDLSANMYQFDPDNVQTLQSSLEGNEINSTAGSGINLLGFVFGLVPGALGGAWDDLRALGMIGYGILKLGEMAAFAATDPYSATIQAGYTWNQTQGIISTIWTDFGEMVHQTFVEGMVAVSLQGEWASPWNEECSKVEFIRGYIGGFFVGYVIEQVLAAFIGVSEIKTAVKAGWGATKIGQAIVKGLTLLEKFINTILTPIKWVTQPIMDSVAITVKKIMIRTFTSWSDEAVEGFARIVHHGGRRFARDLMGEMGEAGLKRASKKILKLADEFGGEAIETMAKSKIGRLAVSQDWSLRAQRSLLKALQEPGSEALESLAVGISKTKLRKMGVRLSAVGADMGDAAAVSILKSGARRYVLGEMSDNSFGAFMKVVKDIPDAQALKLAENVDEIAFFFGEDKADEFIELLGKHGPENADEVFERLGLEVIEEEEEEIVEALARLTDSQLDTGLAKLNSKLGNKLTSRQVSQLKSSLAKFEGELAEEIIDNMGKVDPQGIRDMLDFFKGTGIEYPESAFVDLFTYYGDDAAEEIMEKYGQLYGPAFLTDRKGLRWAAVDTNYAFRGDNLPPDEVFKNGFKATGTNYDYENHVMQRAKSGYVGSSRSLSEAKTFAADQGGGYVYFMRDNGGTEINKVLPKDKIPDPREFEVVYRNTKPGEDIIFAMEVNAKGDFTGGFISNPAAKEALEGVQEESAAILAAVNNIDDVVPVGSACFVAGTLVLTPEGAKPIKDIEVGDIVIASDSNKQGSAEVLRTFRHETRELIQIEINGEIITTTKDHPFFVRAE